MVKQQGGRRTRKANMWAKAAGEYYRSHKNDPKIREFSDVLKSPDFKKYYLSKYGKGKGSQIKNSKKNFTRRNKKISKKPEYEQPEEGQEIEEGKEGEKDNEEYEWVKVPKKGKKMAKKNGKKSFSETKSEVEEDGWKWGGNDADNNADREADNDADNNEY
jgi:hypothetical protein